MESVNIFFHLFDSVSFWCYFPDASKSQISILLVIKLLFVKLTFEKKQPLSWIERKQKTTITRKYSHLDIMTFQQPKPSATFFCSFKQILGYKCLFSSVRFHFFSLFCLPFSSLDSNSVKFVFLYEEKDTRIKHGEGES